MRPLGHRANRRAPHSITPQFIKRGNILPGVLYQVKRRDKQRNRAPWSQQQIHPRKFPIMFVYARLTQIPMNLVLPPRQQHPHIAVKFHILGRPRAPAPRTKPGANRVGSRFVVDMCDAPQGLANQTNSPPGSNTKSSKQEPKKGIVSQRGSAAVNAIRESIP